MAKTSRRFMFDSVESAAEALTVILMDARSTKSFYRFSGLTPAVVFSSGLLIEGELDDLIPKLEAIDGSIAYED